MDYSVNTQQWRRCKISKMFDVKIVLLLRSVFGFCFVCVEDYVSCTQLIQPVQLLEANA